MGFFDLDGGSVVTRKSSHGGHKYAIERKKRRSKSRSRSRSRSRSPGLAASIFGGDNRHSRHNSSRSSFFGIPNASRSSFFGFSRPSYYKRSPRQGFIQRAYKKLKHLLRDLVRYAKRNPLKVFFIAILPLLTGGVLTALLARFGLRIPPTVERMLGAAGKLARGDSVGLVGDAMRMAGEMGSSSSRGPASFGMSNSGGWSDGLKDVAKMFS